MSQLRCCGVYKYMKRLCRFLRWLLVAVTVAIFAVLIVHLALRPNADLADAEQYAVLSAYIEPNLSGYSHDLGSREDVVVIAARTTSRSRCSIQTSSGSTVLLF